jgi:hypothetical protein
MSARTTADSNDSLSRDFLDFITALNWRRDALLLPETVTQFGRPPNRIDLLNAIDGVTFGEVWKGASTTTIGGQKMRVIGLNELRKNKSATGRHHATHPSG